MGLLDQLDSAAGTSAWVRFLGETDEMPLSRLWQDSLHAAGNLSASASSDRIGLVLGNDWGSATALLGAWLASLTPVSLPLRGRGMSGDVYAAQVRSLLQLTAAERVFVPDALLTSFQRRLADGIPVHPSSGLTLGPKLPIVPRGARPGFIQCTSGTTGAPKAIKLGLDAISANVDAIVQTIQVGRGDVGCSWLPFSHDMGLVGMFLGSLVCGAAEYGGKGTVFMDPMAFASDPSSWMRACSDFSATITAGPNFGLDLAVRTRGRLDGCDLSALRCCLVGGELVNPETLTQFETAMTDLGLSPKVLSPAYGLAEASLAVTMVPPGVRWRVAADAQAGAVAEGIVSCGPPLGGTTVRIADGPVGAIQFNSPSMLSGYEGAGLPLDEDGFFTTSDLGYVEGGELVVLGRRDEALVTRGRQFDPAVVEHACSTHSDVRVGGAVAVNGSGGIAVVVEVSDHVEKGSSLARICGELRAAVVAHCGVAPATVVIVASQSLPRTPSGKPRRLQVAEDLAAQKLEVLAALGYE